MSDINVERSRLKLLYRELYDQVEEILFRHDPIGINFEDNTDEYDFEVGTILPRLKEADSEADVRRIVHEEFVRWFDGDTVGHPENYHKIAGEIWSAWLKFSRPLGK